VRPVGVADGPGQEPLPVVRIGRHLRAAVSSGASGWGGLGFPTMPVGGQIACATRLCLVGGWLAGLSGLPPVTRPTTSMDEGDDVDIGTSIFVP
jgi:hypothetical protein